MAGFSRFPFDELGDEGARAGKVPGLGQGGELRFILAAERSAGGDKQQSRQKTEKPE